MAKTKQSTSSKKPARASKKVASSRTRTSKSTPAKKSADEADVAVDRRASRERRKGTDRRQRDVTVAVERRKLERRVKVNRRRQIDPTTCERDYTTDEIEFMNALDDYKRTSGRMFPTCSEILEVLKRLGYQRMPVSPEPQEEPEFSVPIHDGTVVGDLTALESGQFAL